MEAPTADSVASATAALAIDSSLPLWFKPELFLEPNFSPTAYVSDLKRYVSRLRTRQFVCRSALFCRWVEVLQGRAHPRPMGKAEGCRCRTPGPPPPCRCRNLLPLLPARPPACCRCRWRL